MRIEILDLGINNLKSVRSGLLATGSSTEVDVISSAAESKGAHLTVLPGTGNFGAAMKEINNRGFGDLLISTAKRGDKIFGVCLGMQLLFDSSEESQNVRGLSILSGTSKRLPEIRDQKIPNVGWQSITVQQFSAEAEKFQTYSDVYFVHSYYVEPTSASDCLHSSNFGNFSFTASVMKENVIATQFHPEKSSKAGLEILKKIANWANG